MERTTTKKAVRLTDLVIERVAFVPKGDNPGATIAFWKSDPGSRPAIPIGTKRQIFEALEAVAAERFPNLDASARIAAFVETEEGRRWHAAYAEAPAEAAPAVTKAARSSAQVQADRLEHEVRAAMERDGTDYVSAFTAVTKSAHGQEILAEFERARAGG
jgi:hypothetical protein